MPKEVVDYKKTVMYKIQHLDIPELVYINHTTNFDKRKSYHKKNASSKSCNMVLYGMINGYGGWNNFNMIQISEFPCKDKKEANKEQDRLMREMKSTFNGSSPYFFLKDRKHFNSIKEKYSM